MVLINKIELINDTASTLNSHFFDHLNKAIVFTHKQKVSELNTHTHLTEPFRLGSGAEIQNHGPVDRTVIVHLTEGRNFSVVYLESVGVTGIEILGLKRLLMVERLA